MKTRSYYGTELQVLEPEESWAQAMPRFAEVFPLDEAGELNQFALFPRGRPVDIFRHRDWQAVALVADLFFYPEEDYQRQREDWYRELHGRDHLAPLLRLLRERGTPHFYLAHTADRDRLETVLVPPERQALNDAMSTDKLFFQLCNFAVDERCDWGLVSDSEGFLQWTVLGGAPAVMEPFIAASGGLDELMRLFSRYIEGCVTPASPDYNAGEARFSRELYDYLGWPWPFAEPPAAPT